MSCPYHEQCPILMPIWQPSAACLADLKNGGGSLEQLRPLPSFIWHVAGLFVTGSSGQLAKLRVELS